MPFLQPSWSRRVFFIPYVLMCLVVSGFLPLTAFGAPILASSGTLMLDTDTGTFALDTSFTAGWENEHVGAYVSIDAVETGVERLEAAVSACFETGSSFHLIATFDPPSASFTQAVCNATAALSEGVLSASLVVEPRAAGLSLAFAPTESLLQEASAGFNLDAFGAIQTSSCALFFSQARAHFQFPLEACEATVSADIRFDGDGFGALTLSTPTVGSVPLAVSFGAFLTFTADEKTLEVVPSLSLDAPDGFDLYTGLDWDPTTRTLSGLQIYGLGYRCELGDVGLRVLVSLDPHVLALVKAPYRSLIGLVWPMAGPCDEPGEGSVAFFFGEDGLFDLGDVLAEIIVPLDDGLKIALTLELPVNGSPTISFGWDYVLQ